MGAKAAYRWPRGELEPLGSDGPRIGRGLTETEYADQNMRRALFRYGAKYGLPNMSRLQCITELRLLDRILDEDLDLADRIEAEMGRRPVHREGEW